MATRSRIAIENEDGSVKSVYCHFDGYLEGVGTTLLNHYNTKEKVEELVSLGSLSALYERVKPDEGENHSFGNAVEGITIAYHRDRGESLSIQKNSSVSSFFKGDIEEHGYCFSKEGEWLYKPGYGMPGMEAVPLAGKLGR